MHKLKLLAVLLVASLWLPCMASEPANETSKRFELPHWAEELSERVNFHGYAQAGYNYQCCDGETQRNTFQLYRVLLWANINITDRWTMRFMHDFASKPQEFYTDYRITNGKQLSVRFGQFKNSLTMENPMSPTKLELIECYSQAVAYYTACGGPFGDTMLGTQYGRDLGLELFGELADGKLLYNAAVMNGQGVCVTDKNHQKDYILKLDYRPVQGMRFVATGQLGKGHAIAESVFCPDIKVGDNYKRNRATIGTEYKHRLFSARAEYLAGWDGDVKSHGAYCTVCAPVMKSLDIVGSVDYFDGNKDLSMHQTNYVLGMQYWFAPKCRLQAQVTECQCNYKADYLTVQAQLQVAF